MNTRSLSIAALALAALGAPAGAQTWFDDFDTYTSGDAIEVVGQPHGWESWSSGIGTSTVTDAFSSSGLNSLCLTPGADTVVDFGDGIFTGGQWVFAMDVLHPSPVPGGPIGFMGRTYWIMLNTYAQGGPYSWSVQVFFDGTQDIVDCDCNSMNNPAGPAALIRDAWVTVRADIDLDLDVVDVFYDGESLTGGQTYSWTAGIFGTSMGQLDIQALDLYPDVPGHPNTTAMYVDGVSLTRIEPQGVPLCSPAAANSTGQPGTISAFGSQSITASDLTLTAGQLPPGQFGYFLVSRSTGSSMPPASSGTLCLANDIGRYNQVANIIQGPSGSIAVDLDALPTNTPGSQQTQSFETLHFQCWYRDGQTSNFTDGVSIVFF